MAQDDRAEGDAMAANASLLRETIALLPQTLCRLDACSSAIPSHQDFHFYSNFPEFRDPVLAIQSRVQPLISRISSLSVLHTAPSRLSDPSESLDWLVDVQDDILEGVDSALDLLRKERAKQGLAVDEDGFIHQKVRKKRSVGVKEMRLPKDSKGNSGVSVAGGTKSDRCPIPFHLWSIPRPQDKFDVPVDNSNTSFKHPKRLLKNNIAEPSSSRISAGTATEMQLVDSTNCIHPLEEELRSLKFEGYEGYRAADPIHPTQPKSLSETPFTFIDSLAALKHLSARLRLEREIAVDLEHHQFRSFQGLTCLMQISTQLEDFIIDTLELRSFIGPQLQDVFANPTIEKVMHGADWDILWLQRDFGIYVCNLFDTGQASRVLGMKSYSLSYLLEQFCGVITDKRYQLADWRLRPLPTEMLKYAREDTHYLLYVKDVMRQMLVSTQCGDLHGQEPLLEVYQRSRDICLKLYEKELTTERSYLHVYGLHEKQFGAEQLATLAGLYSWRDQVARSEDESTGYVLPNHLLLKLAEEMPDTVKKLRSMLSGRHQLVTRNMVTIVDIICKSKLKASMFLNEAIRLRLETEKNKSVLSQASHLGTPIRGGTNLEMTKREVQSDPVSPAIERLKSENTASNIVWTAPISPEEPNGDITPDRVDLKRGDAQGKADEKSGEGLSCLADESPKMRKESGVVINRARTSSLFGKTKERDPCNVKLGCCLTPQCIATTSPRLVKSDEAYMVASNRSNEMQYSGEQIETQTDRVSPTKISSCSAGMILTEKPASSNMENQSTSIVKVVKKPQGGLPSLLGKRSARQVEAKNHRPVHEDTEQMEARLKAAEIRQSLALPFHTFHGMHPSDYAASENKETTTRPTVLEGKNANELGQLSNDDEEGLQSEDVILFEANIDLPNEGHGKGDSTESSHLLQCGGNGTDNEHEGEHLLKSGESGVDDEQEVEHAMDALELSRKGISVSPDGSLHRRWWPVVVSSSEQLCGDIVEKEATKQEYIDNFDSELPLSISEKYSKYRQQIKAQTMRDQASLSSSRNTVSDLLQVDTQGKNFGVHSPQCDVETHGHCTSSGREFNVEHCEQARPPLEPFDYAAAKRRMPFARGFTDLDDEIRGYSKDGFGQYSNVNHSGGNETFFDPLRRIKDFRPEGITPGKRRQVFPQTGNRTGLF